MRAKQKHPPPRVIAIDVDGTLFKKSVLNDRVVAYCKRKKEAGFTMILWSSRGEAHARTAAVKANIEDIFDHIISKPGYIVDDQGWDWIKYTKIVRSMDS